MWKQILLFHAAIRIYWMPPLLTPLVMMMMMMVIAMPMLVAVLSVFCCCMGSAAMLNELTLRCCLCSYAIAEGGGIIEGVKQQWHII